MVVLGISQPRAAALAIARFDRRRRRRLLAAEAALAIAALWLIGPRVAALRLAAPMGAALLPVLFSWGCAFAIELTVFFAVSWDDLPDLLLSSLRASAPAMWFAPAMLLLSAPSHFAVAMGLLLVANTTRLLVSRNVPHKLAPVPPPVRRRRERIFRNATAATDAPFWREALPPVIGALALQTGLCGIWSGHPMYAALLMACGAAIWTGSSIARGSIERKEDRPSHGLLSIALTLLLATGLTFTQIDAVGYPIDASLFDTMRAVWQQMQHGPIEIQPPAGKTVARLVSPQRRAPQKAVVKKKIGAPGSDLAPGVILRVDAKPHRPILLTPPSSRAKENTPATVDRPLTMPFTGEYRLFPTSSARLKHGWVVEDGTLLEHVYATTLGGSLETEALQRFHPPIDFASCGLIELLLRSEEEGPFGVTMQLAVEDRLVDLDTQLVGFDHGPEETLEFAVPSGSRSRVVGTIRVGFHRIPQQGGQSMRVAIQRITLLPAR